MGSRSLSLGSVVLKLRVMNCEEWTEVSSIFERVNQTRERDTYRETEERIHKSSDDLIVAVSYLTNACTVLAQSVGEDAMTMRGWRRNRNHVRVYIMLLLSTCSIQATL